MSDIRTTYLLPCSCGRDIRIELRQAGETVRCECGRTSAVPTMRAIRSLRPASASNTTPAATKPAWGNPQRFLVAGLVVVLLAAIAAAILYIQFPAHFAGMPSPETVRQHVKSMSIKDTRFYFHRWLEPGIDISERADVQRNRSQVYLGMAALAVLAAIGLILAGVGAAGIVRRK